MENRFRQQEQDWMHRTGDLAKKESERAAEQLQLLKEELRRKEKEYDDI